MSEKDHSAVTEMERPSASVGQTPQHVVGIGASAGGLESLEKLFRNLPCDTNMAFVVVQHLSPDFKSMMYELLARDTQMPIHRVEDGMSVAANTVYLLPPRKQMTIAEGRLHLADKDPHQGLTLPIDHFFESLARECGPRAIGIVLSGSGSDGSRGVMEIARGGGFVISETAQSAKFDSMPVSAQASGCVDLVLAAEEMGATLHRYATAPLTFKDFAVPRSKLDPHHRPLQGVEAIYELFRESYNIDFSGYRDTTMLRRINRRLALAGITNTDEYVQRLMVDPAELNALFEDLLIGVTQFFRDADAFDFLGREVLPGIIERHEPNRTIRAWVSACATGEEAYSLAMAFVEAFERVGRPVRLKLFATDIHKASLERAGRGFFKEDSLVGLSDQRRQRFFIQRDDGAQVTQELRKLIVFAPHNLLCDAPFTDLDFVSCRNLLIYFQPPAQHRAISMMHYSLRVGGVLLLGSSETLGDLSEEFEPVNERLRIFRKRRGVRLPAELRSSAPGIEPLALHASGRTAAPSRQAGFEMQMIQNQLLNRHMPTSLLVNEARQLIDSFGGAEKLLRLPARGPSLDVLDLIDQHLRPTLSGALRTAESQDRAVTFANVKLQTEGVEQTYNLTVSPLKNPAGQPTYFLIRFDPIGPRREVELAPGDAESGEHDDRSDTSPGGRITQLESELRYSKENLQATIEELETSNEEMQATNEELIASNEELQSTNEELHSVNEELYTVNAEHQRKISELADLNRDMNHLLENTDVATVFLDKDLCVRRFTSRIRSVFDLMDRDVGRPIGSFFPRIEIPDLVDRLRQVLQTGEVHEAELHPGEGISYLMRLLPYRTERSADQPSRGSKSESSASGRPVATPGDHSGDGSDGDVLGVVMMLIDVSSLEELRGQLRWMSAIVASTDDAIIGQDLQGRITSWNIGAERLYDYTSEEAIGQPISMLVPSELAAENDEYLSTIRIGARPTSRDTIRIRKDGTRIHVSLTVSPVLDAEQRVIGISKIARDITSRIEMEEQIRRQIKQREHFLAMLSHELRNPLSAMLTAGRLLRDPRVDEDARRSAAATVERQVGLMKDLLNDLLDVSRISLGKIELKRKRLDLRDLVDAARETTASAISDHHTDLVWEIADEPLPVYGDAARLIQVQVNLIHNAAKYSPPGGRVVVSMYRQDDEVVLSVKDAGEGIAAEFLPQVFEPFVQADATASSREGGLGVGLALVKTLVELHGGGVEAFSGGHGLGSRFVVRLPLDRGHATQSENGDSSLNGSLKTTAAGPIEVVLVEDREENRNMLRMLLELEGHSVVAVGSGEEGLEAIRESRPEMGLLDIGLPGMDGYEVARRVRQDPNCDGVVLVALTGFGQQADIERAMKSGFDGHLVKPIMPEELNRLFASLRQRARSGDSA